jgi:hypothetical protein
MNLMSGERGGRRIREAAVASNGLMLGILALERTVKKTEHSRLPA